MSDSQTFSVKDTINSYINGGVLNITSNIGDQFGTAIGTAIQQLFSNGINLGNGFTLTSDTDSLVTITGAGAAAPLLPGFTITATFAGTSIDEVTLTFDADITAAIPVSQAWPSLLGGAPFDQLEFTGGSVDLTVKPADTEFVLAITAQLQYNGSTINNAAATGILQLQYKDSSLGFLGGAVVDGTWTPSSAIPVLGGLTFTAEVGAFFSTFATSDLSGFSAFPFVPSSVVPGLNLFSEISLGGDLAKLTKFLAGTGTLQLTAVIPTSGDNEITAVLANTDTTGDFEISEFSLDWDITASSIAMDVTAAIQIPASLTINDQPETIDISGQGTFVYGSTPSLTLTLLLTGAGGGAWVEPFGIPDLTIVEANFDLSLNEEGIAIGLGGTIDIGSTSSIQLTVQGVFDDFEVPVYIGAGFTEENPSKPVPLGDLIDQFLPSSFQIGNFPLLQNITIDELSFYACAAPCVVDTKSYLPGIGATGDISFYGYSLDFAISIVTDPAAVKAKGTLYYLDGNTKAPIVISGGGINWLTLSSSDGTTGPSACIDTTASGYCTCSPSVTNAYFCLNGMISVLGLASISVVAAASSTFFELDINLSTSSNVFTGLLHLSLDMDSEAFNGSASLDFSPGSITIGPLGVIPSFSISGPDIDICLALGTAMPTSSPCTDGWMPSSSEYFYFELSFSWGVSFSVKIEIDINQIVTAFSDFGTFLIDWIANNALALLGDILKDAEQIATLLLKIGWEVLDVAKAIVTQLGWALEDAMNLVSNVWNSITAACGVTSGDQAMSNSSTFLSATQTGIAQPYTPIPIALIDLAENPAGHDLLTHYYLNRVEADTLLRFHPEVIKHTQSHIAAHRASSAYQQGQHLPLLLQIIQTTATYASPAYRDSAATVVANLTPFTDKTYDQLVELLKAS